MTIALITGIAGQDGYYLQKRLLMDTAAKAFQVFGLYRGQDEPRLEKLQEEMPEVVFLRGDITDATSVNTIVDHVQPDVIFNLAGVTNVGMSFQLPHLTFKVNTEGVVNLLEAIKLKQPDCRFFQASTSEIFGNAEDPSQSRHEESATFPTSPYGISKLAAHLICRNYRASYDMHISTGISFNHESPRRPPLFVTRKVTQGAARIAAGKIDHIELGNFDAHRDWGYAADFADAFVRIALADEPGDYVLGTGIAHSIEDLVTLAFKAVGIDNWEPYVHSSARHHRPEDTNYLLADPSKAKHQLDWEATTTFEELISMMVKADLEREGVFSHV